MIVYKVLKHNPFFYSENLEIVSKTGLEIPYSKQEELDKFGWCYITRKLDHLDMSKVEFLVINDSFEFQKQWKVRTDIVSLIREYKINSYLQ